jgi:DNA-directed RNA polymerase specialized sigma24 family protein
MITANTIPSWPHFAAEATNDQLSAVLKPVFSSFLNRKFASLDLDLLAQAKRIFTAIYAQLDWQFLRQNPTANQTEALARVATQVFTQFAAEPETTHRGPDHPRWNQVNQILASGLDGGHCDGELSQERLLDLYRQLDALAKTNRQAHQVLCRRFLIGMTMQEVCADLQLSVQNVRTLENKGLNALKAAM